MIWVHWKTFTVSTNIPVIFKERWMDMVLFSTFGRNLIIFHSHLLLSISSFEHMYLDNYNYFSYKEILESRTAKIQQMTQSHNNTFISRLVILVKISLYWYNVLGCEGHFYNLIAVSKYRQIIRMEIMLPVTNNIS